MPQYLLLTPTVVAGVRFHRRLSVCLTEFPHDILKIAAAPNLIWKCSTMNPRNHLFWGQKVKGQGHEAQNHKAGVGFARL